MMVPTTIFNTAHYTIEVDDEKFRPYEERVLFIERTGGFLFRLRSRPELRIGKQNNAEWAEKRGLAKQFEFNMVYDAANQHKRNNYDAAIRALSDPIIKALPEGVAGYTASPQPGINLRFFSSYRIEQQGKATIGPEDIFYSHGIGDKNYWIGKRIAEYSKAFVPGPVWEKRMRDTGYTGEIFIVGYTKLDPLFNGEYTRAERTRPYVVWAPTHGYVNKNKGRSSYPQCMELIHEIPDEYETKIALHPTSKLKEQNDKNPTMQELLDADVVIADGGSTIYEAWALGKPVIFPDWICKDDILNHFEPGNLEYEIYNRGIGYHARNMDHMNRLIKKAIKHGITPGEEEFIEGIFPKALRGKSGKTAAAALLELC